jgi:aminoglycoside phosphotransferase (APT) family kinase protein
MPRETALDPLAVLQALGVRGAAAVAPVTGGTATSIWRVELQGRPYALRVYARGATATCQAELAALRIASRAGAPVPAVQLVGAWRERPAMLIDWCEGATLGQLLRARPWLAPGLGAAFGRAQAQLHRTTQALDLSPTDAWIAWGASGDHELAARLRRLSPGSPPALLHLDYHLFNAMSDGRQVTAIIDWANGQVGDARADLARTYSILLVEPWQPGRQPAWLTALRKLFAAAWWRGYRRLAGDVGELAPFLAWAGAAMVRDLSYRVADPGSWWTQGHLDAIESWARRQRRLALAGQA